MTLTVQLRLQFGPTTRIKLGVHNSQVPSIVIAKGTQPSVRLLPTISGGPYQVVGSRTEISSLPEIKRSYPDQWVAIAVQKTDADGLPSAGVVLVHDVDEQFVWPALSLGEADDLVYVFYTGGSRSVTAAA